MPFLFCGLLQPMVLLQQSGRVANMCLQLLIEEVQDHVASYASGGSLAGMEAWEAMQNMKENHHKMKTSYHFHMIIFLLAELPSGAAF